MRKLKHITTLCEEAYERDGVQGVYDMIETFSKTVRADIKNERCNACESHEPSWEHRCLVCGQPTSKTEPKFYQAVLKPIKDVMQHVYPKQDITLEERLGDCTCPDCGGSEWMLFAPEQVAVKEGGKAYIECLGCAYITHL